MPARKERKQRKAGRQDQCQTPPYALAPLLPYLPKESVIWEPCCGEGNIVSALTREGYSVVGSDIESGQDFRYWQPPHFDLIVTNPPYSQPLKNEFFARAYQLGKPFAFLVQVDTVGNKGWQLYAKEFGYEQMHLDERIDFKMPGKGYKRGGANFAVTWLCWRLLPERVIFGHIEKPKEIPNFSQNGIGIKAQERLF